MPLFGLVGWLCGLASLIHGQHCSGSPGGRELLHIRPGSRFFLPANASRRTESAPPQKNRKCGSGACVRLLSSVTEEGVLK